MTDKATSLEQMLDTKQLRRMNNEAKQLDRIEQQERDAGQFIGEICRNGQTIYYVNFPRYREGGFSELVAHLARANCI